MVGAYPSLAQRRMARGGEYFVQLVRLAESDPCLAGFFVFWEAEERLRYVSSHIIQAVVNFAGATHVTYLNLLSMLA